MAFDYNPTGAELHSQKSGLLFDADGVTLIARLKDELSAYRMRKTWKEVLAGYFLLEQERDYEMSIVCVPEHDYFVLNCFFISACGRYAFWRLMNDQAPEAELKLSIINKKTSKSKKLSFWWNNTDSTEHPMPKVHTGIEHGFEHSPKIPNDLLQKLKKLFS
jgi:hypothetical protein